MSEPFRPEVYGLETVDLHSCFEAAQGLYWHCVDYHEGGGSERYRISCELRYKPGALECGPETDSSAEMIYADLASGLLEPAELLAWVNENYDKAKDLEG